MERFEWGKYADETYWKAPKYFVSFFMVGQVLSQQRRARKRAHVEHALEINFSSPRTNFPPKISKESKETIAVRQNKQTLIETVIKFCMWKKK